jgi:hypothetical protein
VLLGIVGLIGPPQAVSGKVPVFFRGGHLREWTGYCASVRVTPSIDSTILSGKATCSVSPPCAASFSGSVT